ncbi:MAG: chorismate mutase [Polaromonas sp.]|uniref:chorismate mutase n=1 Tax=Polaromonas sp. TaxID=1869339 RepID=UPI002735BB42|nr:chorismate mutase [Polaromonas sp.]MDP3796870.1 chorismate mutase [Polaromonas sp.]
MNKVTVQHCDTMADVRRHIDALDDRIVALLAERSGYVAQAARIKQRADQVYDQARIDFIIDRVRAQARQAGAPEAVMEATYRAMIAAFIEFEHGEFARLKEGAGS